MLIAPPDSSIISTIVNYKLVYKPHEYYSYYSYLRVINQVMKRKNQRFFWLSEWIPSLDAERSPVHPMMFSLRCNESPDFSECRFN